MFKGLTNTYAILLLAAAMSVTSCGNSKTESQVNAENILSEAQSLYDSGKYMEAIGTIDSLMKKHPGIIDVQRQAMHLKTLVVEKQTILDSIANDSAIVANKQIVDSLANNFKYVKTADMVEGYYVSKNVSGDNLTKRTNIEARINEMGEIYLVSSLYGKSIKHTKLRAVAGDSTVETEAVPYDNARNYRFKDGGTPVEMVTFRKADCDTLCQFIADNVAKDIKVEFVGGKKYSLPLPSKTKNLIAETYIFATHKAQLKKAEDLKLYYMRKLQITRKQSRQTATNIKGDAK